MKQIFKTILLILLVCGLFVSSSCATQEDVLKPEPSEPDRGTIDRDTVVGKIVENGRSGFKIVYPETAGAAVRNAAEELQAYIEESSGVLIRIETSGVTPETGVISLGKTPHLAQANLDLDYTTIGEDGFFLYTAGGNVLIDANTERGILYGVYDFLEQIVGVKFLTHDETYVPVQTSIPLYKMDLRESPAIRNRVLLNAYMMGNAPYAAHLRMNNEYINIPESYGGRLGMFNDGIHPTHNMLEYVPVSYFEAHPDWFLVENGEPVDLCYSHVGILEDGSIDDSLSISPVKVAIETLKGFVLQSEDRYFMIGQMDRYDCCQCADCREEEAKYKRSGMNIRFINAIYDGLMAELAAEGVEREIILCTFAYHWSSAAPVNDDGEPMDETVIARDNVAVRLAPIQAYNYYSVQDKRQVTSVQQMFKTWPKVAKRFMIWTYDVNYANYLVYYPTMQHWQEDLRFYQEIGAEYVMFQAAYSTYIHWMDQMEAYVASKLMWNPDRSAEEVKQEYLKYYYGPIAAQISEFIDNFDLKYASFLDESYPAAQRPNTVMNSDDLLNPNLYTVAFWERQFELLDTAEQIVNTSDLSYEEKLRLIKKINMVRLTPQYMVAMRYDSYYPDDVWGKKAFLKEFFDNCAALGFTTYRENGSIEGLKVQLGYSE